MTSRRSKARAIEIIGCKTLLSFRRDLRHINSHKFVILIVVRLVGLGILIFLMFALKYVAIVLNICGIIIGGGIAL